MKNTDSAQAQLHRASMPGKDLLMDAVRKIQAAYEMCFLHAIQRDIKNI